MSFIKPIIFHWGFLTIPTYSVLMAIAFLTYTFIAWKRAKDEIISSTELFDVLFFSAIFGLIGARIYYVIFNLERFGTDIISYVAIIQNVGLSFHGALIGAIVGLIIFCKRKKWSFWKTADLLVIGLPLAQAIGSLGCLASSCSYGKPSRLPWAIELPGLVEKRHPAQIYEAIFSIALFILLVKLSSKKRNPGFLALTYLIIWGIGRFALEYTRGDSVYLGSVKFIYIINAVVVIIASLLFYFKNKKEVNTIVSLAISAIKTKTKEIVLRLK